MPQIDEGVATIELASGKREAIAMSDFERYLQQASGHELFSMFKNHAKHLTIEQIDILKLRIDTLLVESGVDMGLTGGEEFQREYDGYIRQRNEYAAVFAALEGDSRALKKGIVVSKAKIQRNIELLRAQQAALGIASGFTK